MLYCAVDTCHTQQGMGYSLFNFPKDLNIKARWLAFCNIKKLRPTSRICEIHFEKNQIRQIETGRKDLRKNAIPTIRSQISNLQGGASTSKDNSAPTDVVREGLLQIHFEPSQIAQINGGRKHLKENAVPSLRRNLVDADSTSKDTSVTEIRSQDLLQADLQQTQTSNIVAGHLECGTSSSNGNSFIRVIDTQRLLEPHLQQSQTSLIGLPSNTKNFEGGSCTSKEIPRCRRVIRDLPTTTNYSMQITPTHPCSPALKFSNIEAVPTETSEIRVLPEIHENLTLPIQQNTSQLSCSSPEPPIKKKILTSSTTQTDTSEPEDQFDHFCRSLANELRQMPLRRAVVCQVKLQEVMTEERLYQIGLSKYGEDFDVDKCEIVVKEEDLGITELT